MAQLIRNLDEQRIDSKFNIPFFSGTLIIAIVLGIFAGYLLSMTKGTKIVANATSTSTTDTGTKTDSAEAAGVPDSKMFQDKAEGLVKEGGIEGEGSFHLEREGGKTQWAYLTSTTVDMGPFVGKKVEVWGKTYQGEKAGWLMEVGFIKVIK